jgi:hypothetical protein
MGIVRLKKVERKIKEVEKQSDGDDDDNKIKSTKVHDIFGNN